MTINLEGYCSNPSELKMLKKNKNFTNYFFLFQKLN